jgi:hypothetical protein
MGGRRKGLAGTAFLLPVNPQLQTSAWRFGQLSALCRLQLVFHV